MSRFVGHRVLVVEYGGITAHDISDSLKAEGADVLAAHDLATVLAHIKNSPMPDGAVLDVRPREDDDVMQVAHALSARGIKFLFVSDGHPKPYRRDRVLGTLQSMLGG
jgi:CheY-like chemotaxis protein